jgi:hypothetical protein
LSQIYTNPTQTGTPAFIPNKWADPLGQGGANLIRVKTEISTILCEIKLAEKLCKQRNIRIHDKIIQYFPQL